MIQNVDVEFFFPVNKVAKTNHVPKNVFSLSIICLSNDVGIKLAVTS